MTKDQFALRTKKYKYVKVLFIVSFLCFSSLLFAQEKPVISDTVQTKSDELTNLLEKTQQNKLLDSLKKAELEEQLSQVKENEKIKRDKLLQQLKGIEEAQLTAKNKSRATIEKMKLTEKGYPVILLQDTLFTIYTKVGALKAKGRANAIAEKITKLYEDDFYKPDSIKIVSWENSLDISYDEMILMSVNDMDALWFDKSKEELADNYVKIIKDRIDYHRQENSLSKLLVRIGLVLLVVSIICFLIWSIHKLSQKAKLKVTQQRNRLNKFMYREYVILSSKQVLGLIYTAIKGLKWLFILILLYLLLPLVFSIFPFTQDWATRLFELIWSPFKSIFKSIWDFLPNLFTLIVIFIVMRYFIRFVKYIFREIEMGKLVVTGFHTDWSIPTFNLVKLLLYAFMFILMFPYLPGSDSSVFKGVSVFIGLIFSFGSSNAISNMVSGLVITYMRPFQIGDQIRIGDLVGVVTEKTMLVTRLKTVKNEEITIPNSTVLSGNTTNYSRYSQEEGLIIYTTADVGYEVSWKDAESALLEAARRTKLVLKQPQPFIFQQNLADFYATYEINIYIANVVKKAGILADLRNHIQDVFHERGIELMSPHFRTILPPDEVLQKEKKTPPPSTAEDKDIQQ
ncbi:mechanosensitive ion channel family protein [Sphingobacterium sp. MYb382]|uniref:mechanosensitive ion channel family protein n=1 Tax=Sphingobacterium sp. MYb382 TaxID=2745278 RepID=UPI0030A1994D